MTALATTKATAAHTILERAVCLTLECHYLGNNRKVDLDEIVELSGGTLTLDEQQFHATKRLIDTKELRPVLHVFGRTKSYLRSRAISTHRVFGERSYLVALALVEEVDVRLAEFAEELTYEATALADRYLAAVERQRAAIGPLFDERQYLTPEQVRQAFRLDWAYVSFAAPDRLEHVSRALYAATQARFQQKVAAAYDEVVDALRGGALTVLRELCDRLKPGPDGKPKVLRGTALRDLQDFLAVLPQRNITDDDELTMILQRVAHAADGLDVETLRSSLAMRGALQQAADQAAAAVGELIQTGRRGLSLGGSLT